MSEEQETEPETPASHQQAKESAARAAEFEERRLEELAEARRVHAERGSEPDAQQRIHAELPDHR